MAEIRLSGLSHRYPGASEEALQLGDFCWRDGGAYALLGPSGCGKSTLLNIISGILEPSAGQVFFDGQEVTQKTIRERNIAQVFQFPVIYDTMSVFDNLAFPLRNRKVNAQTIQKRVNEIAELLELSPSLLKRAQGLSADQKQLISLGRGLVRDDVSAILFDEPLTVIDPHQKFQLRRKLKAIHQETQLTLIYVTHDQSEALTFADEVAVMNGGRILQSAAPEQLFDNPSHRFVGHFIGSPGMNFLSAELKGDEIVVGDDVVADSVVSVDNRILSVVKAQGGKISLGIRPEYAQCCFQQSATSSNTLPVQLQSVDNHGSYYMLNLICGEQALMVRSQSVPESNEFTVQLPLSKTKVYLDDCLVEV